MTNPTNPTKRPGPVIQTTEETINRSRRLREQLAQTMAELDRYIDILETEVTYRKTTTGKCSD